MESKPTYSRADIALKPEVCLTRVDGGNMFSDRGESKKDAAYPRSTVLPSLKRNTRTSREDMDMRNCLRQRGTSEGEFASPIILCAAYLLHRRRQPEV